MSLNAAQRKTPKNAAAIDSLPLAIEQSVGQEIKMIRRCKESDFNTIFEIINDAARAYKGVIPEDRWNEPYMPFEELMSEIEDGVVFWGLERNGQLLGVMGIQDKDDVTLIRHAYVRTRAQKMGIGTKLLQHLESMTEKPVLIGTWSASLWAISFYEKNGYTLVSEEEKNRLLSNYWSIPDRQVETSVVLANQTWYKAQHL
jgi:N-acetylglutamate synthase-like GNAT family acetyltransferase